MATEADVAAPVCDTIREEGKNVVDQVANVSITKLLQYEKIQADTPNQPPTIEGDNFFRTPSIVEVHCEVSRILSDVNKVTEKQDAERVGNQLSKDTTCEHDNINDPEVEILDVLVKTDEDHSFNITSDDTDQSKMTAEQEGLDNERNIAEKLDGSADAISRENITFSETIKEATSESDNLQRANQEKMIDAVDRQKEVLQNFSTISNEETEENLMIKMDASEIKNDEHLGKESETTSSQLALARKASDVEASIEEAELREADSCETKKSTETTLLKNEAELEKPNDSLCVASEDVKASDLVLDEKTEDKTVDAAEIKEENIEDVSTVDSNEKAEDSSLIQVDGSKTEHEENLEKEIEKTTLKEASVDDANDDESIVIHEARTGDEKNIDSAQDYKTSASSEEIETTCSLEEQSLTANPQTIMNERKVEATETQEVTLENVATTVTQEDYSGLEHKEHLEKESGTSSEAQKEENNEEHEHEKYTASNLVKEEAQEEKPIDLSQVATKDVDECDSSQDTKMSFVEKQILTTDAQELSVDNIEEKTFDVAETKKETDEGTFEDTAVDVPTADNEDNSPTEEDGSRKPSLEEAPTCNVGKDESAIVHEAKFVEESSTKADLYENENNAKATLMKEEVSIESLQVAIEDSKAFASVQDRETCSIEEQSLTVNSEGTMGDHKGEETNDATSLEKETPEDKTVATTIPYEDTKEKSLNQDHCSRMEQTQHLEKESENEKASTSSVEEQVDKPIASLQVATEDIKASVVDQDTEIGSVKEQIPTTEELLGENTEEKTIDPPPKNEETLENTATLLPHEDTRENSSIQVDFSAKEHEEHLEKESENPSMTEAASEETNEDKSISIQEPENEDDDATEVELVENEKCSTSIVVQEEIPLEKPIDFSQVDTDDITESDSCQDTKLRSIEEQILTVDPQGISSDLTEGKHNDAADTKEETLEDNETNGDTESPIEEDGSQKPYLEEDSTREKNDDESTIKHEAEFVDESSTKKDTKNASIKEEVSVESLRVGVDDIEAFASTQDKETSSVDERSQAVNCEGTIGDQKEDERNDATSMKEETPQDKNVGTTIIYEDTQEKSLDQDDCSPKEQSQHLKKESENLSLIKASIGDTGESTLVMKEVPGEMSIDSSRVAIEDIKESAPSRDTKTSSINDQILTTEQNLGDNTEEIIVDPRYTNKETPEQNVATIVPHEDTQENSLIQVDCSEKEHEEHLEKKSENPSITTVATEETNEDESRNVHECENRDDDIFKAELLENEMHTASTVVKDEAPLGKSVDSLQVDTEDVNEFDSTQDKKISSIEEQILTTDPREISSDKMEGKTTDAAETKEETLEVLVANVPIGDDEDTLIKPSLEEASTRDANEDESMIMHEAKYVDESSTKTDLSENAKNIENTSVNEEESIESLQVPAEDVKAFASVQDRETSSLEKQGLSANCQEIIGEHKENLEKESETPSLTEAPAEKTDDDESKDVHEPDRAELLENENFTVSTLVKEEARVEEPIDSLKVATEDVEAFDSGQDSSTKEQILITGTKEISPDKIDAINSKEDTLEDTATNVPNGDEDDNSPINEDGSQKTSPEEASTHSANEDEPTIMHEDKYVDDSSIKVGLFENEKNIGDTLVNEEVSEDIKELDSVQITEMSCLKEKSPVADCQGIIGPDMEDKTNDQTTMKEQTPGNENVSTTIPNEDKEEKSLEQGDCSQVEHHENESEIPSLTEALTAETEESTLITKELELKEPINSSQVASEDNEDIKATVSCQDTEASSIEEQVLTIDPQKIPCDKTEEKIVDAAHTNEENVENIATIVSNEETIERTLVKEEAQVEKLIDSFQVDSEDIKASALGPDLETSSIEEQIQIANLQEISGDNIEEKTIDEVRKEEDTFQDMATNISSGDNEDSLPIKVDEPQVTSSEKVSMGNAIDNEPTITHEAKFADENLTKADLFENEKNTKDILVKEEGFIETAQVAVQDIETSTLDHVRQSCSIEEQSRTSSPQGIMGDQKEDKTIDAAELQEETPGDKNVATTIPKEDNKKNSIVQVDCSHLEKESENSSTTEAPTMKEEITDTNISSIKETVLTEDPQEISEDNTEERTIDATEIKEETQEVQVSEEIENVEIKEKTTDEEKDCLNDLQMTTAVSIATHEEQSSDSSAIKIPNVNNVEDIVEDPNCKQNESSIPNVSEEHINISNENVANITSSAFEASEISESSDFVALEEVLPSNVASEEVSKTATFEEIRREIKQDAENEEAQKQEEDLHVLELIKDSSMENVDKDAQLANAHESDITQEMQKVEERFSPSPDEKRIGDIIEKTDHKEIEAVEDAIEDKYIEQMEQDDATKSTLPDTEPTESEQKETECRKEEVMLEDIVDEIKESTSIPVAKDFLPKYSEETSEVETEMKVADTTESTVINNNRSLEDNLTNSRSIMDLETTIADEAPEVIETIPNIVEGQEVESRSVGEISVLISQCEKEEYDHASIGSLTEKSDSNEVESAHGENKGEYDSEIKVVEPISQVQSCDIIPQAGEAKTDEENLEAAAETKSEAKDKFETNETITVDISSKKVKEENEDAGNYHVKEENEDEVIKTANDTEKVLKVSEEADDKAVVEQECTNEEIHGLDHVNTKTGTKDSADGVYSSTILSLDDGDTIKGVDGVDNELAKDEGSIYQNSNTSVLDAAAEEQPKTLDENICEAASTKTDHKNNEQSEDKKGNEDTIMMEHQEEDDQSKHESLPLAELAPEKESDKQDHRDKICSDGANDIPRDNENTTNKGSSEEKCQNKSTESQISSISKDIELIEQASKATTITAEMQETEAGTLSCDVPEQMEVDGRQVKEVSDECKGMAENSASIQPSKISTSVVKQEYKVGTASEAEDQLQELHDLPQESHIVGSEVKMVQGDGPADLHKVTNASEDVSNKENLREANPNENIDAAVSSEGQVAEAIQKSTASETFEEDIQESERTFEKEKMLDNEGSDLIENSCNAVTEMSSQTNIHQSSMEDIAQSDEHAISERDHTKNVNPENSLSKKNISVTQHGSHAGCSQEEGGGEISKPSKQEQEEAHCVHEETRSPAKPKSSDKSETKETCKSSLSELLQVPVKESPQIAAIEKEPIHTEDLHEEKMDGPELEDAKTDEDESSEQRKSDLGSEAPVMVDAGDAEMKGTHKKSHNILSGVGSKVKHSIAKVKKAITGKSSHPKPSSPKEGDKDSKPVVC